jgi:hypothetical protein
MKSLRNPGDKQELLQRIQRVQPTSGRRWGKMSAPKMICHSCGRLSSLHGRESRRAGGPSRHFEGDCGDCRTVSAAALAEGTRSPRCQASIRLPVEALVRPSSRKTLVPFAICWRNSPTWREISVLTRIRAWVLSLIPNGCASVISTPTIICGNSALEFPERSNLSLREISRILER